LRAAARGYDAFYNGGRFEHIITALSEAEHLSVQGYQSVSMIAQFLQTNTLHWHGECETAYRILTETDREQLYAVYPYLGVLHDVNLGNLLVDLRRAPEASALYDDARAHLIAAYGREDFPFWGIVEMQAALVESRDNPTDQLQRRTAHALLLAEEHGIDEIVFLAHMYAAQIVAAKDIQLAYDHIDRSLAHTGTSRWGRRLVLSHAVRCAALFDSPEEVRRWYFQMTAVDTTGDLGTVEPRLAECWMWWRLDERTSALRGIETLLSDEFATPLHRLEAELLRLRITTDPTSNEQARITSQCTREGLGTWANQLLEGSKPGHIESQTDPTQSPVPGIQELPDDEAIREMRDLHCDIEIDGYHESFQGREIQILFLMARGASNTEIADIIYISVNTVRWYARQIYVKLDVRRRGEAVQAAWRLGLIGRRNGKSKPRNT
jgi:ATP/maltotriose-dependent transcriptional regulator MalT